MTDPDPMVKRFHDSIRTYCIERAEALKGQWSTPPSDSLPRYFLLQKMLVEIERRIPSDFQDFHEIKTQLAAVVEMSEAMALLPLPPTFRSVMLDEKNKLAGFIGNLAEKDMGNAGDLFFRRVLGANEKAGLWAEFKSRSCFGELAGGFEVVVGNEGPGFDDYYITGNKKHKNEISYQTITKILRSEGVSRVWVLRDREGVDLPSVEMDVMALDSVPYIFGVQIRYLFSDRKDWAICSRGDEGLAPHNVVGEWLVKRIKENMPMKF